MAEEIQNWKLGINIAQLLGGTTGVVGGVLAGLYFFTPLARIAIPLIGSTVVAGAKGIETFLLKDKLEEAKQLAQQDKYSFLENVNSWFVLTKDLKETIESLISYNLLKEMSEDLKVFYKFSENRKVVKLWIKKMLHRSRIVESFGLIVAPVAMTLVIVICLLRDRNCEVCDCAILTDRLEIYRRNSKKSKEPEVILRQKNCLQHVDLGIIIVETVIHVLDVVKSSVDIYNRHEDEDANKIKELAELLEDELTFFESVYSALQKRSPLVSAEDIVGYSASLWASRLCALSEGLPSSE